MKAPPLLVANSVAATFPLAAAAIFQGLRRGPRAWILAWSALLLAETVLQVHLARLNENNIWLNYIGDPASAALALWALAWWQTDALAKLTLRLAAPATVAAYAVLAVAFDRASTFSRAAEPMANLVCLAAAAFTLVARSRVASGDLLRQDWFWVSAGLALYTAALSTLGPASSLLLHGNPDLFVRVYEVNNALQLVAMVMIARGVTCPAAS